MADVRWNEQEYFVWADTCRDRALDVSSEVLTAVMRDVAPRLETRWHGPGGYPSTIGQLHRSVRRVRGRDAGGQFGGAKAGNPLAKWTGFEGPPQAAYAHEGKPRGLQRHPLWRRRWVLRQTAAILRNLPGWGS